MTGWYSFFKIVVVRPAVKYWFRVEITGAEKVPGTGCILAANHLDVGDTFSLPALVRPTVVFPAKRELFEGRTLKGRALARVLRAIGQTPIDRSGGRASASGLGSVEVVLEAGGTVGIFPEGTRSPDGRLYKGKTGVARLALASGKPVLPVGVINTRLMRNRIGLPVMMDHPRIIIGDPLDFSAWAGQESDHKVLRWVTNEVMGAIKALTDQPYVDAYASRVKYGDLASKDTSSLELDHPNQGVSQPPIIAQRMEG